MFRFCWILLVLTCVSSAEAARFEVVEATIAEVHAAMAADHLTCRALVDAYLERIATYDKNGPAVNSIVLINPHVREQADELDRRFVRSGMTGPLHCVPLIVKDNFETEGLRTTDGSLSLAGYIPANGAFQVKRAIDAGALVLANSNMAEWAFTPYETVSSILPGYTKNPYVLDRVTAGSSGGTAAAIASSFGLVGFGSDTGNSIRGPSSHDALVGIRSTMGLTSRSGVFPLNLRADIAGPMARTVEDAARLLQVIAGEDPEDSATRGANAHLPQNYLASLDRNGLRGARIGVLHQAYDRDSMDPEVIGVFKTALEDLRRAGATVIDPADVAGLDAIKYPQDAGECMGFKYDINQFLTARGSRVPVHSLAEIIKSGKFHPSVERELEQSEKEKQNGPGTGACQADDSYREKVRQAVVRTMDKLTLDAFVYPTWSNPPRLIGDLNTPAGDNSQFFSPVTGFPAMNVPMGFTRGNTLPAGMTFYGRPWSEPTLLKLSYAYEQATHHRRAPSSTPPLR